MNKVDHSMALTPPSRLRMDARIGALIAGLGLLFLYVILLSSNQMFRPLAMAFAVVPLAAAGILATTNWEKHKNTVFLLGGAGLLGLIFFFVSFEAPSWLSFILVFVLPSIGAMLYFYRTFGLGPAGIKNNGNFHSEATKNGGVIAWMLTIVFTGFYVCLYWFPSNLYGLVSAADPMMYLLTGKHSVENGLIINGGQWFTYTMVYSFLVLVMGFRYVMKYRHNRYQLYRTLSVTFFQWVLAWILPAFLAKMQGQGHPVFEHYLTYFWPLGYSNLMPDFLGNWKFDAPAFTKFVIAWSVLMSFVAVPVLTYFYGKRWYCSWVCGCGGLAETAGDSFRHLSDKSLKAWRFERISIYSVLVLITLVTAALLLDWKFHFLGDAKAPIKNGYAFLIGSIFAGVVGTGFYPILGSRVWCRFGCPQAAILGILQKYFSRFRITTNGAQCISCGNCSTYCEMGIDVKAYAQRGQNIVRASCVGCGVCSAVCPRGVLNLENGPLTDRINDLNPISFDANEIDVKM